MSDSNTAAAPPPTAVVLQLLGGFQVSQAVYVVAKLGVATILEQEGPTSVADLAERTGADAELLHRLIRSLTAVGLFAVEEDRVAVTALGEVLSEQHPQSLYDVALMWMETHYLPFGDLLEGVRTGRPAAEIHLGEPTLTWMASDPARAALFSRAMAEFTSGLRAGMFDGYRLPPGRTVADLGAADGSVLVELLTRDADPGRRGIVFDLPTVAPLAGPVLARAGLADRVEVVGGDLFEAVPAADT